MSLAAVSILPLSSSEAFEKILNLLRCCVPHLQNSGEKCYHFLQELRLRLSEQLFPRKHLLKNSECSKAQFQMWQETAERTVDMPVFNWNKNIRTEERKLIFKTSNKSTRKQTMYLKCTFQGSPLLKILLGNSLPNSDSTFALSLL